MLTINRFDASGGAGSNDDGNSGGPAAPPAISSRLAALAERKRKRDGDGEASTGGESREVPSTFPPHSAGQPSGPLPSTNTTTAPPRPAVAGPSIHPSRLASAPILAKEVKKAAAAAGIKKEKTKAKQRYLNKKKLRRKAKKKSGGGKGSGPSGLSAGKKAADGGQGDAGAESSADDTSEEGSGDEAVGVEAAAAAAPAPKKARTVPQDRSAQPVAGSESKSSAPVAASSSSSSDSDDSDSSSESDSDSSSASSAGSAEETTKGNDEDTEMVDQSSADGAAPDMTLAPLVRGRHLNQLTAEAMRSLASQGLPRGMVEPRLVDPSVRRAIEQVDDAPAGGDSFVEASLDRSLAKRLKEMGVVEWFAVQTAVIPHLLSTAAHPTPFSPPRDLCVSAPTGSGKTLAYSIPIVALLKHRVVTRLRALIILPTRDLVAQVRETLELLSKGTGLRIASTTGAQSFAQEQQLLVDEVTRESKLDVLVTTPGRLIDHLDGTPGFTLQHLRFLVIDEADRLLGQSFHNWAQRLRASIEGRDGDDGASSGGSSSTSLSMSTAQLHRRFEPQYDAACDPVAPRPVVQKLLFSATLTREPGKLSELGLRDPVFIDVRERERERLPGDGERDGDEAPTAGTGTSKYTLPATLREHMLIVPTAQKPLHLLHLLLRPPRGAAPAPQEGAAAVDGPMRRTLVFTKSVDSAQRLVRLIHLFFEEQAARGSRSAAPVPPPLRVANYSSDLSPSARRDLLQSFRAGNLDVLVASDLISRGIDLPLVENVICYDAPVDAAKYVHRVGRTARANREGRAWALVEEQEARFFKRMVRGEVSRRASEGVRKVSVGEGQLRPLEEAYDAALKRLVAA